MRARRLKCGSPLGRVIDEGGDLIAYVCLGVIIGYALKPSRELFLFTMGFENAIFYSMELKFIICNELKFKMGEFGPVEGEFLYFSAITLAGIAGAETLN